jgi:hypothetical protein
MSSAMQLLILLTFALPVNAIARGPLHWPWSARHHPGLSANSSLVKLKVDYPWYHTSAELESEARSLATQCGNVLSFEEEVQGNVTIFLVRIRRSTARPINKVLVFAGEHSRELIGPESALSFVRLLCQQEEDESKTLDYSEFLVVLNANPHSRALVEQGQYCVRANPNGIDLNRNWDVHWEKDDGIWGLTDGGPKPFSEAETQILHRIAQSYRPDTFISVHSGTIGMYMPWAFDTSSLASRNGLAMMHVLEAVDDKRCQCPFGGAGKEVGYACPGTCIDYIYDRLNASFAFAYEIYTNPAQAQKSDLQGRYERAKDSLKVLEAMSGLADGHGGAHATKERQLVSFSELSTGAGPAALAGPGRSAPAHSAAAATAATVRSGIEMSYEEDPLECFGMYNPGSREEYDEVVLNWAHVYLDTVDQVVEHLKLEH